MEITLLTNVGNLRQLCGQFLIKYKIVLIWESNSASPWNNGQQVSHANHETVNQFDLYGLFNTYTLAPYLVELFD